MEPLQITYAIAHASEILTQIGQQVPHEREGSFLKLNGNTVRGTLFEKLLSPYLSVYGVSIDIKDRMTVKRDGSSQQDLVIVDFHIDSYAKLFADTNQQSQLITGSYLSSSGYVSSAEYIPGTESKFVSFIVDKRWLLGNIHVTEKQLEAVFDDDKDFFFFREIGYQLAREVHDLFAAIYGDPPINHAYLTGCAYKILSLYFNDFSLEEDIRSNVNMQDLKAIEKVKTHIDMNPGKKILMNEMLDLAAMSESKFRTLFKSVIGSSPSDYHINRKIWYAKSLIEAGEQISSVVIQIGYSNHSYFTRTFKSIFGLTPQKYQEATLKLRNAGASNKA